MPNADKIFVGSGKAIGQYGNVAVSICLSDVPTGSIREYKGKQYLNVIVAQRKQADDHGKTHYVTLDTWKPTPRADQGQENAQPRKRAEEEPLGDDINPEDIPF